jgi:hypothetical protein
MPPIQPEQRLHTRHRSRTVVYVLLPGKAPRRCSAGNISAQGTFILTEGMGLAIGARVELIFTINLGIVKKLHRRRAEVIHRGGGGTGFRLEAYQGR